MEGEFESARPAAGARRSIGPIVLLLPLAFLVLGISLLKDPKGPRLGERAVPPGAASEDTVAGWEGELQLFPGELWRVTLGPLHADAAREEFDSRALARRLRLVPGSVFRMDLQRVSPAKGENSLLPFDPDEIEVVDDQGQALAPLLPGAQSERGQLADPLRVLLCTPDLGISASETKTWFLWGRDPGESVRVKGLDELPLPLSSKALPRSKVDVALLRRDAETNR